MIKLYERDWIGEICFLFACEGRFGTLINMSMHLRARSSIFLAIAATIVLSTASAFAFDIGSIVNNKPKEPDKFAVIRVDKLASLMNDPNSHVNIYDANGWGLRSTAGVVPGAHLLTSDDKYDVAKELHQRPGLVCGVARHLG